MPNSQILDRFQAAAMKARNQYGCLVSMPKTGLGDLVDNDLDYRYAIQDLPFPHTKSGTKLAFRFLERLSMFLSVGMNGQNAVVTSMRRASDTGDTITIWVVKMIGNDSRHILTAVGNIFHYLKDYDNRKLADRDISFVLLIVFAVLEGDYPRIELQNKLYEAYVRPLNEVIEHLRSLLYLHRSTLENSLGNLSGALDDKRTARDRDLSDFLLELYTRFSTLEQAPHTMKVVVNTAQKAARWLQQSDLRARLGPSLGNAKLGNEIVELLHQLAIPQLTLDTMIKFIRTYPASIKPIIKYGLPGVGSVANQSPKPSRKVTNDSVHMEIARESLSYSDRHLPFQKLSPIAKQNTLSLLELLSAGRNPQPGTHLHKILGYEACKTKRQVDQLGYIYTELLMTCTGANKNDAFETFWRALERYEILEHIDKRRLQRCRRSLPCLPQALASPLKGTESIWTLKSFLRDEDDWDPSPCLIRDYGFHMCVLREEVQVLKKIYAEIFQRCEVYEIHRACVTGKIKELVISCGVPVEDKDWRFLQNQIDTFGVGYQATDNGFRRKGGLFKASKRQ